MLVFDSADIYINPSINDSEGDPVSSAPAEASLKSSIGVKRNTEETDEGEHDYSSEEDDELASRKVRKSEVPKSMRTVKSQGRNRKGKEGWRFFQ
ncbi:hypothetical protein HHI36_000594 [Cryptolaemus montrouzieri]|uniref:Uncharacterized protein n=1 Tax=Cryptolaemus montrouzieri TaxID=559131 RepID=A0ABD2P555_9CUCU